MDGNLSRALSSAALTGGVLSLQGLSTNDVKALNDKLREDLLDYNIQHFRVIGVLVTTNGFTGSLDFITKINGVGKSYADLMVLCNELIYADGFDVEAMGRMGNAARLATIDQYVTSSNKSIYCKDTGLSKCPEPLVNDVVIADMTRNSCTIDFVVKEGKGLCDFSDSSELLYETHYKPLRAIYDLSSIFSIKLHEDGDTSIKLNYKKDINERVLQAILNKHGKSITE